MKILIIIWLCWLSVLLPATEMSLPTMGDYSSATISLQKEHEIGKIFLREMYREIKVINDPITLNYLENLVKKLAVVSELKDKNLTVLIIDDQKINAFAAPGGIIGINAGMITYVKNEQELSAVIAHELAHLSQRHFSRTIQEEKNSKIPFLSSIIGGVLLTALGGADAGVALLTSSIAGSLGNRLRFSRIQEKEADNIGIKTLYRAGINPIVMSTFFQRLHRELDNTNLPDFLQTHPVTSSRIAEAIERSRQFPDYHYVKNNNIEFKLIKMRMRVYTATHLPNIIDNLSTMQKNAEDINYGLAFAYFQNNEYQKAADWLLPLSEKNPNNLIYALLKVKILFLLNKQHEAMKLINTLHKDYINYFPVEYLYVNLLLQSKKYMQSMAIVKKLLLLYQENPFLWKKYAEISGYTNQKGIYYIANSNYLYWMGRTDKALQQLRYALHNIRFTYKDRKSIQQQLIYLEKAKKRMDNFSL